MKNIEQELKLLLDEREYRILLDLAQVEPQLQTNFYFGYNGMPRDVMVRIRKKGGKYLLCYKRRMSDSDSVMISDERECELASDYADTLLKRGIAKSELKSIFDVDVERDLVLLGSMDTYRAKFQLMDWTLELDRNVYLGHVDYELECEHGDAAMLDQLKSHLSHTYGIVLKPSKAKIERFLNALN